MTHAVRVFEPHGFDSPKHFYPEVLNAHIHPLVKFFFSMSNERIARRYAHLHPDASIDAICEALEHTPEHMRWGGADLFYTTSEHGVRQMVLIETNSSPSGQKSMPVLDDWQEQGGYRLLLERAFLPMLRRRRGVRDGVLAVLYDKNEVETTGYAATLSTLTGEKVYLVPWRHDDVDPPARVENGVIWIRHEEEWLPVRGAIKYVTQRPWSRIPPVTKTLILNSTLVCLSGGRNKLLAAKAYDLHNAKLEGTGLKISVPETIWDVSLNEVPLWVERMGGVAVVKVPYSNAGQGVYTITSDEELEAFMSEDHRYDKFIVQALIGNRTWTSRSSSGRLYHVGTVPDRAGNIFVADVRLMVGGGDRGFFPVALYARRAHTPLSERLGASHDSWSMLGTNLSYKDGRGEWATDTSRLLLMDSRNFNRLGLGLDDLVEAYIQTVLAMTAIDDMAGRLLTSKGLFRRRYFGVINEDERLVQEIVK